MSTKQLVEKEIVSEAELAEDISYFYSHFFKYDLTDDQIAGIIG